MEASEGKVEQNPIERLHSQLAKARLSPLTLSNLLIQDSLPQIVFRSKYWFVFKSMNSASKRIVASLFCSKVSTVAEPAHPILASQYSHPQFLLTLYKYWMKYDWH